MNIEEFANSCNTSIKTVKKWIDSNVIKLIALDGKVQLGTY